MLKKTFIFTAISTVLIVGALLYGQVASGGAPEVKKMEITVNNHSFSVLLENNKTAEAFRKLLPFEASMSDLNHNEKYYYLPQDLPVNARQVSQIHAGDIMLFGNNCLVLFYKSFSTPYAYTPIGRVENPADLAKLLGKGNVTVIFK